MWIELHQSLPNSKKIMKLRRGLKIKKPAAIGHMCLLWLWALDNATDGDLSEFTCEDIAEVAEWPVKDAEAFANALIDAGFLDVDENENLSIHNWSNYAGKLIEQKEAQKINARNRQRERRERIKREYQMSHVTDEDSHADVTRDNAVTDEDSHADVTRLPNLTIPNLTIPNLKEPNNDDSFTGKEINSKKEIDWGKMALSAFRIGSLDNAEYYAAIAKEHGIIVDFEAMEIRE